MFCNPCLTQLEANEQSLNLDSLNDFTIPPNAKLPLEQIAANVRFLPDVYIYIDHVCFGLTAALTSQSTRPIAGPVSVTVCAVQTAMRIVGFQWVLTR